MPRQLDGTSLWRKLTAVELIRIQTGTIGDTTTTAAVTGSGAETTVAVTAITNFAAGDKALISGDGGVECVKVGAVPATAMPVSYAPKLAQSSGARFVEAVSVPLGKIGEAGLSFTPAKPLTPILSAVDDGPINFIDGTLDMSFAVPLLEYDGLNHQLITGYADAETGAGSAADPYQAVIGAVNQVLQGIQVVRFTGIRHDGKFLQIDALDVKVEPSQGIDHNRQGPAALVLAGRFTRYIVRRATAAFTN